MLKVFVFCFIFCKTKHYSEEEAANARNSFSSDQDDSLQCFQ